MLVFIFLSVCHFKVHGLPVVANVGTALIPGGQIAAMPTPNLILTPR